MKKGELMKILAELDERGVPDSAEVQVKTVGGEAMQINGNSFIIQGEDSEFTVDAQGDFAGITQQPGVIFLKQV